MKLKNILALALALVMVMSFAACGGNDTPDVESTTTEPETTVNNENTENIPDTDISYFSLNLGENADSTVYLSAYPNEDGTVFVQYMGEVRKETNMDKAALNKIAAAFEASGLTALNGQEDYLEGDASASMYVCYTTADGEEYVTCGFSGTIPEAFTTGFNAVKAVFEEVMADVPEYVAQPLVIGELTAGDKAAIDAILSGMNLEAPDAFAISNVANDEYMGAALGLSTTEHVVSGLTFSPMMMTTPYSLSIVTLDDAANAEAVAKTFTNSIDWQKWVCVNPESALVAVKDNQVLCLIGAGDIYSASATAIEAAGWTTYTTLANPNL